MPTYVAFLRAINLGATRKFPAADVVAATGAAGFDDVATYINTGNVRVRSAMRSRSRVESALEAAYLADRGFEVPTIAYSPAALREVHETAAAGHDGQHYVALLRDDPAEEGLARLRERLLPGERVEVGGRALHLDLAQPQGRGHARRPLVLTPGGRPSSQLLAAEQSLSRVRPVTFSAAGGRRRADG